MSEIMVIWFAQAVAHSLWAGSVIGAGAWVLVRGYRKCPARQHAVLCGALLLLALCLPVLLAVCAPGFPENRSTAMPVSAPSPSADAGERAALGKGERWDRLISRFHPEAASSPDARVASVPTEAVPV